MRLSITNLEEDMILIEIKKDEEKKIILDQLPCPILGHCLDIKKWEQTMNMNDINFERIQL